MGTKVRSLDFALRCIFSLLGCWDGKGEIKGGERSVNLRPRLLGAVTICLRASVESLGNGGRASVESLGDGGVERKGRG